jgi:hypothetical protein
MIYWHRNFTNKSKVKNVIKKGKKKKKSGLVCGAMPQCLQIEMDKTFETIKVDHNFLKIKYKILPFFMKLKDVQSLAFDFNY